MTTNNGVLGQEESNEEPYGLDAVEPSGEQQRLPVPAQPAVVIAVPEELERAARRVHRLPSVQAEVAKIAEEEARREARRQALLREGSFRLSARTALKRADAEAALRDGLVLKAFDDAVQTLRPHLRSERSKKAFDQRVNEALDNFSKCDDLDDELGQRVLGEIQVEALDSSTAPTWAWWYNLRETLGRVPPWAWLVLAVVVVLLLILM